MDRLTKEQRHRNMSNIKNKDTGIEIKLRKALWEKGYRYRKNYVELPGKPDIVLTDAMSLNLKQKVVPIIKGDLKSETISAASIIAKVYRDNLLKELDKKYPMYNFKNNKGYPTKDHKEAIEKYGIIKEHRKTYAPIKNMDL